MATGDSRTHRRAVPLKVHAMSHHAIAAVASQEMDLRVEGQNVP